MPVLTQRVRWRTPERKGRESERASERERKRERKRERERGEAPES